MKLVFAIPNVHRTHSQMLVTSADTDHKTTIPFQGSIQLLLNDDSSSTCLYEDPWSRLPFWCIKIQIQFSDEPSNSIANTVICGLICLTAANTYYLWKMFNRLHQYADAWYHLPLKTQIPYTGPMMPTLPSLHEAPIIEAAFTCCLCYC